MVKALEPNATISERIDLEPTLAVFRVRPDPGLLPPPPWFEPGQYVTLGVNRDLSDLLDRRPLSVRRPMSIASAPEDDDFIEFYIRRVPSPESELPLTHVLWPMQVGERVHVRTAATGKFTIRDTVGLDDRRLKVCVAAGTGLAPFLSMARSRVRRDPSADLRDLAILHGASYPTGLGYAQELETLKDRHGLRYLPTVSRPPEDGGWRGFTGRVETLFERDRMAATEAALGLEPGSFRPDRAVVLLCGLQGTIANTISSLLFRGFTPDHRRIRRALEIDEAVPASLFWEQYDTSVVLDLKDETLVAILRERYRRALDLLL